MNTLLITALLSFAIMLVVIAGMSIGVLNGRKAISGSCGGLNSGGCELCSKRCRNKREKPDGELA
jgi:hypothetical protein